MMQEKYSTPNILDTASDAARITSAHSQSEAHTQPCSLASGGQPHTACPRCAFAGPHQPGPGCRPPSCSSRLWWVWRVPAMAPKAAPRGASR